MFTFSQLRDSKQVSYYHWLLDLAVTLKLFDAAVKVILDDPTGSHK
jgi:hypothetical protein